MVNEDFFFTLLYNKHYIKNTRVTLNIFATFKLFRSLTMVVHRPWPWRSDKGTALPAAVLTFNDSIIGETANLSQDRHFELLLPPTTQDIMGVGRGFKNTLLQAYRGRVVLAMLGH